MAWIHVIFPGEINFQTICQLENGQSVSGAEEFYLLKKNTLIRKINIAFT